MSEPSPSLAEATLEAARARERLAATSAELRERLSPGRLVRDARHRAADAGSTAARAGVDNARNHPGRIAAAGIALALLLGRHRIAALFRRRP